MNLKQLIYLTKHPLDNLQNILKENNISSSYDINMYKAETHSFICWSYIKL